MVKKRPRRGKAQRAGTGRPSSLAKEQIEALIAARGAGKTVIAISEEFGVSTSIVYRHLRNHRDSVVDFISVPNAGDRLPDKIIKIAF